LTKMGLAPFLGDFFTNSSGHPACRGQSDKWWQEINEIEMIPSQLFSRAGGQPCLGRANKRCKMVTGSVFASRDRGFWSRKVEKIKETLFYC
jgi:hypothetical protein